MYSVSDAFKNAIKDVVIEYSLEGTIGTVAFTQDNVVQGTFHISNQCTDTNEIVLGSAYIGQLEATFTGLSTYISRNDWVDKVVTPYVRVVTGTNTTELIPMGIFTIKEVKHTAFGTEVKAYDNMYKFDKLLDAANFDLNAQPYDFLQIICSQCDVVLGMSRADVEDLPNGEHTMYMCGARKETMDYASDVETYRDALFYLAQACACFATINRSGQLELRKYKQSTTDTITEAHRIAGAEFADYVTSYSGLYVESLWEGYTTFYGYDLEELQANKTEAEARKEEEEDAVEDIEADIAELVRKHEAHEITDEEYAEQRAEKDAELREAESALKMTNKYLKWVNKAIATATAGKQGVYMDLGGNPFLQHKDSSLDPISDVTTATVLRTVILNRLSKIEYVPFSCSTVFGIHYDLGDRIMFTGGHADDDLGCLMAYDWTYNGEYVMHGFGPGSDAEANMMANVRPKADKEANRANINALNRSLSGTSNGQSIPADGTGRNGDVYVRTTSPMPIYRLYEISGWRIDTLDLNDDGSYNVVMSGTNHEDGAVDVTNHDLVAFKVEGAGSVESSQQTIEYTISGDFSYTGTLSGPWMKQLGIIIATSFRVYSYANFGQLPSIGLYQDNNECGHLQIDPSQTTHFEGTLNLSPSDGNLYVMLVRSYTFTYEGETRGGGTLTIQNFSIGRADTDDDGSKKIVGMYANVDGHWKDIDYVQKIQPNTFDENKSVSIGTFQTQLQDYDIKVPFTSYTNYYQSDLLESAGRIELPNNQNVNVAVPVHNRIGDTVPAYDEGVYRDIYMQRSVDEHSVTQIYFKDPHTGQWLPYVPEASSVQGIIPIMTSDNQPYGVASASSYYGNIFSDDTNHPYHAFDDYAASYGDHGLEHCWLSNENDNTPYLQYTFRTEDVPVQADLIWVQFIVMQVYDAEASSDYYQYTMYVEGLNEQNTWVNILKYDAYERFNIKRLTEQTEDPDITFLSETIKLKSSVKVSAIRIRFTSALYTQYIKLGVSQMQVSAVGMDKDSITPTYSSGRKIADFVQSGVEGSIYVPHDNLDDLQDVDADNPSDGDCLVWDDTNQKWVNGAGSGSSDVELIEISKSEYDQLSQAEKNDPNKAYFVYNYPSGSGGSGGASALVDLSDVVISSPTNGQVLKYNNTTHVWENAAESGGGGGSYAETVLFTNSGTGVGDIALSEAYTNYDQIYFECIRYGYDNYRNYIVPYYMPTDSLTTVGHFQFFGYNEYMSFDVTDSTHFTKVNNSGNLYINRIIGIKY